MSIKNNTISKISIYRLDVPLIKPYKLSYNTFHSFEPLLIHIIDSNGNEGWGEQHISPGSSNETRDGGWTFARILSKLILNKTINEARKIILSHSHISIVASSTLHTAIDVLAGDTILGKKDPLSFREVKDKFNANLNFANIKQTEIQKLEILVDNFFDCKNFNELENIDFS